LVCQHRRFRLRGDRGRNRRRLAVYSVLVRFAGWLWINLTQNIYSLVVLAFVFVFIFVVGIVSLALLIELGFRRGTRGSNRFGPDPLAKT
jgi:uncharacterized membrane protein YhaH (DUF805 family)